MVGILGAGTAPTSTKPAYTGLQLQTSANGLPIPIVYGQAKLAPNLIWYGDFAAISHKESQAGKGGGATSTTYTYQAAVMLGLCEGPIVGILQVWADKTVTTLAALNMSLLSGTSPQALWGYIATHHPDQALNYPGTALVAVAPYALGNSAGLPNHNFETQGLLWNTSSIGTDAAPAMMINDYLTNQKHGCLFPSASIDQASLMTDPGSYHNYTQALGLGLSAALTDQEAARDCITRWLTITNTAAFNSGDMIKFVPYGDETIVGNGFTYIPNVTPQYDLDDDDYIFAEDADPVLLTRVAPEDCKNWVSFEILDRSNGYSTQPIDEKDEAQINQFGLQPADIFTAHEICRDDVAAISANLTLQRNVYIRNTYAFTVGWEYGLLEPMDIITLTDSTTGMVKVPVRITSIEENDNCELQITAEEFPAGVATATAHPKQARDPYSVNYNISPGPVNPPVIFEPEASLTGGVPEVWCAVSGGVNWGGATVFLSADNTTYKPVGVIGTPSRLGSLSAGLGAVADPDTTSTIGVDLTMSPGAVLLGGTHNDADMGRTLCYVDGELISYATATLTAVGHYNLTYLRRGQYGTTVAAHLAGSQFARIDDDATLKFPLPLEYVGQTIWLKFVSVNIYGHAEEDQSEVVAYEYDPNGRGSYIAPPGPMTLTSNAATQSDGSHVLTVVGAWGPSDGPLLDHYEFQYQEGAGAPELGLNVPSNTTSHAITPAKEHITYSGRVRAISSNGYPSTWVNASDTDAGALSTTVPSIPTGISAVGGLTSITVSWAANPETDIQWYRVSSVEGTDSNFADAAVVYQGNTLTFAHTNLGYGETRTYWVEAYNIAGYSSPGGPKTATSSFGVPAAAIGADAISSSQLVPVLRQAIASIDPAMQAIFAGIKSSTLTVASQISTVASAVTTVQTSLNGNTALVSEALTSIDGVKAQYTVQAEIAVGGVPYIAGFGLVADLINGVPSSEATFLVEKFIIGQLNSDGTLSAIAPFVVQDGQVIIQDELVNSLSANKITSGNIGAALITVTPSTTAEGLIVKDVAGNTIIDSEHGIFPGASTSAVSAIGSGVVLSGSTATVTVASGSATFSGRLAFILVSYSSTFSAADHGTNNGIAFSLIVNGSTLFSTISLTGVNGSFVMPYRVAGTYSVSVTGALRDSEDTSTVSCEIDIIDFKA